MIIAAALKVMIDNQEVIVPCLRHGDGYFILHALAPEKKYGHKAESGFINHKGEFLDRAEAFKHAIECGQTSAELRHMKQERKETLLYSEDLY